MKLLSELKKQLEDLHLENEILKTEVETYKRRYHSAQQMQQQMQQQILQQQVNIGFSTYLSSLCQPIRSILQFARLAFCLSCSFPSFQSACLPVCLFSCLSIFLLAGLSHLSCLIKLISTLPRQRMQVQMTSQSCATYWIP